MKTVAGLVRHLQTLTQEQLAELLRLRRDAAVEPAPKSLDQLAGRLGHPASMVGALALLTLPQLQVAEAVAALLRRYERMG